MDIPGEEGLEFDLVKNQFDRFSGSRRDDSAITIKQSGRAQTNVDAAEEIIRWLTGLGLDPYKTNYTLGANDASGTAALFVSSLAEPGSMALTWHADKKAFSFHIGGAFKEKPLLRPASTVLAGFVMTKDKRGKPCLVIKIKGATPKRKGAAADDEEAAAGKQEKGEKK
ncbi:MAG TPA: hypothetical protein VD969_23480 [Symbiobacteriaceae bacterium]|nr:hypothetical protein [Symbiobacteriaceae bacterium]